jgi:hypothetical protein
MTDMNTLQIPTPEADNTSGDKSPSFSPSARESASKRRERTVACGGDTLTPCDEIPSQRLASAAVTATVTGGPEGRVHPGRPAEEPRSQPARAAADVSQQQPFPSFMRRYIDMAGETRREMDQPRPLPGAHFVPRAPREAATVTPSITPPESPPPKTPSVTGTATRTAVAGSICPTCGCRVPARLSAADRQRAYRQRKQGKPVVP